MAISPEMILATIAVLATGIIFFVKIIPKFKEAIGEIFPYPKAVGLITTLLVLLIGILTIEGAIETFSKAGILTYDAMGWLTFITLSTALASNIISEMLSIIYYIAILFVGYALLQISRRGNATELM